MGLRIDSASQAGPAEPTPEELEALLLRLRALNAPATELSVEEFAAANGVSKAQVRSLLAELRAAPKEAPVRSRPAPRQYGLLGLCLVLFAAAGVVYKLNPARPLTDQELDERLEWARANRANRPKRVTYPIKDKLTSVHPPHGFIITFGGELTQTLAEPLLDAPYVGRKRAIAELTEALLGSYRAAEANETNAPRPASPLPPAAKGYAMANNSPLYAGPNGQAVSFFTVQVATGSAGGGLTNTLLRVPVQGQTQADFDQYVRMQLSQIATSTVDTQINSVDRELEGVARPFEEVGFFQPPIGFTVNLEGNETSSRAGPTPTMLPSNADAVMKRLEYVVREMVMEDQKPDAPLIHRAGESSPKLQITPKRVAVDLKIDITGVFGDYHFTLPYASARKGPRPAYAAAREAEQVLQDVLNKIDVAVRRKLADVERGG